MLRRAVEDMGHLVLGPVTELGGVVQLFFRTLARLPGRRFEFRRFLHELMVIGWQSTTVIAILGLFTGMVLIVQTGEILKRFGAEIYASQGVAVVMLKELGPVLAGFLIAGRVGSGIAAEIGSMKISDQLDAMRSLGADPIRKLVVPKSLAAVIALPLLTVVANAVGIAGGMVMAALLLNVTPFQYLYRIYLGVDLNDYTNGVLKTTVFGLIIVMVASYHGFRTTGGTVGVGRSATRSVVMSCILILLADLVMVSLLFVMGWN